jgi:hypothetical protein
MFRKLSFVMLGLLVSVVAACGSSPTGSNPGTPAATTVSQAASPLASAAPVSYDPCVLVTSQEASALTGVNYGPGRPDMANQIKECIYGYQTTDVFIVGVLQAPDLATAQAGAAQAQALAQQAAGNGLTVTQVQGLGDAATEAQGTFSASGTTLNVAGVYVLKGTVFFMITDVAANRAAPGTAALQAQATTVLGRL